MRRLFAGASVALALVIAAGIVAPGLLQSGQTATTEPIVEPHSGFGGVYISHEGEFLDDAYYLTCGDRTHEEAVERGSVSQVSEEVTYLALTAATLPPIKVPGPVTGTPAKPLPTPPPIPPLPPVPALLPGSET